MVAIKCPTQIVKRNGEVVAFDEKKIYSALVKCMSAVQEIADTDMLTRRIVSIVYAKYGEGTPTVENVQDTVEIILQGEGLYAAAKHYILYRAERTRLRTDRLIPQEVSRAFEMDKRYFPTAIQSFQFYDKYSRFNYDLGRRETWVETVDRSVDFLYTLAGDRVEREIYEKIRNGILNMEIMPSMRLLAMAGKPAARDNTTIYNCFSGDTGFVSNNGIQRFDESVGKEINVLTSDGTFKVAEVKSFGIQRLNKVTLKHWNGSKAGSLKHYSYVTANHRWILLDGSITTSLKVGDKLISQNILNEIDVDIEGIRHGIIYGDGTITKNNGNSYAQIRLCGAKASLIEYFNDFKVSYPETYSGDPVIYCGKQNIHWKKVPVRTDSRYVAGFIKGLMLTDGSITTAGNIRIDTQDAILVEWLMNNAASAGYKVLSHNTYNTDTNFGKRSNPLNQVLLGCGISAIFKVEEIEELDLEEEVYCIIEPITQSFMLENGQITGNCSYLPVDSIESFVEALFISMAGCGVGFSVEESEVQKLPQIKVQDKSFTPDLWIVEDSAEGWGQALRIGLQTWFNGKDIQFSFHMVRKAGSVLYTKGGRACLTGDTVVFRDKDKWGIKQNRQTIKDLFDLYQKGRGRSREVTICSLNEETGEFYSNRVLGVVDNGIAAVYEVTLSNGYKIKATNNHRFMKDDGSYQTLYKFAVGHLMAVNGQIEEKTQKQEHVRQDSYGIPRKQKYITYETIVSINYAGEKQVYDIQMQGLDHNFVANGFVSHNSGPEPLQKLLDFARGRILARQGRRLRTIDAHDIMCAVGSAAVAGGVRRTAMISLFDEDDQLMLHSKDGDFATKNSQRWNANNSVVWSGSDPIAFMKQFTSMVEGERGEPGIFSRKVAANTMANRRDKNYAWGTNPCGELVLRPRQFCNLSAIINRSGDTYEILADKARLAAILGTIQSLATYFPNLSSKWKENCEDERLLGVDITGQLDNTFGLVGTGWYNNIFKKLRETVVETNKEYAEKLDINQSAGTTVVKPSGNTSVLVDCSSGLHARWAPYYIKNARVSIDSPIYKVMRDAGVPMAPENGGDSRTMVVSFPVKSPDGAITRNDRTAIEQCEWWLLNKEEWTEHNPSVTITYKSDEVIDLQKWLWDHREKIGGMAFLPSFDAKYDQLPYVEITEEEYNTMAAEFPAIDWSKIFQYEIDDQTKAAQEMACVSGVCSTDEIQI